MSGARAAAMLALLGLLVGLLSWLPLRWAVVGLPEAVRCERPGGTLAAGFCGSMQVAGNPLGTVRWKLTPAALLLGRVRATVAAEQPGVSLQGLLQVGLGGGLTAQDLQVDASLDAPALQRYSAGLRGEVSVRLAELQASAGVVRSARGRVLALNLVQTRENNLALGDYELSFGQPTPAGMQGTVTDRGGPLEVRGTVTLTDPAGYLLRGTVKPRDSAPTELRRQLEFLGPADNAGLRSFAQEATF